MIQLQQNTTVNVIISMGRVTAGPGVGMGKVFVGM